MHPIAVALLLVSLFSTCSAQNSCGAKFTDLQLSWNQSFAAKVWQSVVVSPVPGRSCSPSPFDQTTCDGAAQYLSTIYSLDFASYADSSLLASAVCSTITQSVTQQLAELYTVFDANRIGVQNDTAREAHLQSIESAMFDEPAPGFTGTRFARVVVLDATGDIHQVVGAHTFILQRDDDAATKTASFYFWQANEGNFDLWTWVHQQGATRKMPQSYPGPSAFAGRMNLQGMAEFVNLLRHIAQPVKLWQPFYWPQYAQAFTTGIEWTLPIGNNIDTDKVNVPIEVSVFVHTGVADHAICARNIDMLTSFVKA